MLLDQVLENVNLIQQLLIIILELGLVDGMLGVLLLELGQLPPELARTVRVGRGRGRRRTVLAGAGVSVGPCRRLRPIQRDRRQVVREVLVGGEALRAQKVNHVKNGQIKIRIKTNFFKN